MTVFLDIDGVMVPTRSWKSPELLNDGFPVFSNRAILALQQLLSRNSTIILTTSHKSNYTIAQWKGIFLKRGINVENIKSLDHNVDNLSRKEEIEKWFHINEVKENFVIIDDDKSLNELPKYLKDNLILTSPMIGLTDEHLKEANVILHKKSEVA